MDQFTNREDGRQVTTAKRGLHDHIRAKQDRTVHGSKQQMRKPSESCAASTEDFEKAN